MSLQVRTVKSNFIFYQTDGFGRDTYISYNNGGFWKENAQLAFAKRKYSSSPVMNPQNSFKTATTLKYRSDGSGRDSYILYNEGGLAHHHIPYNALHLQHYLRNDNPICYFRRRPLRKEEHKAQMLLNKIQTNVVDRLYNKEKKKFLPSLKKKLLLTNYNSFFKGENCYNTLSPDNERNGLGMKMSLFKSNSAGNLLQNGNSYCMSPTQDKINRLKFKNVKVLFEPLNKMNNKHI